MDGCQGSSYSWRRTMYPISPSLLPRVHSTGRPQRPRGYGANSIPMIHSWAVSPLPPRIKSLPAQTVLCPVWRSCHLYRAPEGRASCPSAFFPRCDGVLNMVKQRILNVRNVRPSPQVWVLKDDKRRGRTSTREQAAERRTRGQVPSPPHSSDPQTFAIAQVRSQFSAWN